MANPGRYFSVVEGRWYDAKLIDSEQCCDCGLVHRMEYRIKRAGSGRPRIEWRCYRDERATRAIRKRGGITVTRRKPH